MAADSRSTHTDALATLGTIINDQEKRDAIHLGVEPIQAGRNLVRGAHVGIGPDGKAYVESKNIKAVGIVDPFLNDIVLAGQWFWLIVYPRQITSLRHVWEHPDFPDSRETGGKELLQLNQPEANPEQVLQAKALIGDPIAKATLRMREIAADLDVDVDELMEHADERDRSEWSYWVHEEDGGKFEGESIPHDFWEVWAVLRGKEQAPDHGNFLSCSC